MEVLIGGIIFGVFGARIYYVLFNFKEYINEPFKIWRISDGGLAIYGGIIAIVLYLVVYCRIRKQNFLDLADYLVPYLALGQAFGRWGNFFNIEAYGRPSTGIFRMGIYELGKYVEVHPCFLYESIGCLLIFLILTEVRKKRSYKGQVLYLYFTLYSFIRFFIERLRTDSLFFGYYRASQLLSLLFFSYFAITVVEKLKNNKKDIEN